MQISVYFLDLLFLYLVIQKAKQVRRGKRTVQNVFPIIESCFLTPMSLVGKTQKFNSHVNTFLYIKVRHIHSKFYQLHLILSPFCNFNDTDLK